MTDSAADTTTTTPRTQPSDAPTPKRGTGRPRKPPATPKPKRQRASAAVWLNANDVPYLRLTGETYEKLTELQTSLAERGFGDGRIVTDTLTEEIAVIMDKLPVLVAGKLTRALEGLKGGAGEGAS